MTYEELLINIELNGYENVLPKVGKKCFYDHQFVVCDDGDCHLFDRHGNEDDISKIKEMNKNIISKDIKKIIIPNGVTCIWDYAFCHCSVTSVTIPNSVTSIGEGAFYGCNSLISVTIPNNVKSIRDTAFRNCSGLKSLMIPNNVINIGWNAFFGCNSLTNVIIDKPINQIKAMRNYPWGIEDESIIRCN